MARYRLRRFDRLLTAHSPTIQPRDRETRSVPNSAPDLLECFSRPVRSYPSWMSVPVDAFGAHRIRMGISAVRDGGTRNPTEPAGIVFR